LVSLIIIIIILIMIIIIRNLYSAIMLLGGYRGAEAANTLLMEQRYASIDSR